MNKKFTNIRLRLSKAGKSLLALSAAIGLLTTSVYADVLGTHISASEERIAPYTDYHENVFSDSSVGRQTEHYVEYAPNGIVHPLVANGYSAYGKRTVLQAANVLKENDLNPAMGMNADFFSFQTGVPMSNTVIDGRIFTADSSWRPGIGFRKDGIAFCATFPIHTTITLPDGNGFTVECINKYRQPYALYLFTSDYGSQTHSPDKGTDIVLSNVSGSLKIGGEVTAVVESISDYSGSVAIPDGKMILSVSASASDELKNRLSGLAEGQTITVSTTVSENFDLWSTAENAIGALGGKLITNGKLDYEDESAAPRTAVGIKEDGNIIFYTLDGRQSGYSYGAKKSTVARRLAELGCVEAISLDGGGSTSMAISPGGSSDFYTVNRPSDGSLRSCANFLFLTKPFPNGIPYELRLKNNGICLLSGGSITVAAESAVDSSYTETSIPDDIEYYIAYDAETPEGSGLKSYVDENGYLTAYGNGTIYIGALSGDAKGEAAVTVVSTPDEVKLYDSDYGYEIKELSVAPGTVVNLTGKSFWDGKELVSDNSCYRMTLVNSNGNVGTLDSNGTFTASDNSGATGSIALSAGICAVEIPVTITGDNEGTAEEYPEINGKVTNQTLTARITSHTPITKADISLNVDGTPAEFELSNNTVTYTADNNYHRVALTVTKGGKSAFKVFDMGQISSLSNTFDDTANHWAKNYISYLADHKVVNGSLEDENTIKFKPDAGMKRVEFAIMLCNYLNIDAEKYKDVTLPFIDNGDIPWWAENKVKAVYSLGYLKGQLGQYGTAFNPNADINRMEFAISLCRLLPDGLASSPISAPDKEDIPFWAEESMKLAVTHGILSGYPDGSLQPSNNVTRSEGVKMLYNIFGIK